MAFFVEKIGLDWDIQEELFDCPPDPPLQQAYYYTRWVANLGEGWPQDSPR